MLSELSGKNIDYLSPSADAYIEQVKNAGIPNEMIQRASNFCAAIAQGEFDFPSNDLEKLLGRKLQSVKGFLKVT